MASGILNGKKSKKKWYKYTYGCFTLLYRRNWQQCKSNYTQKKKKERKRRGWWGKTWHLFNTPDTKMYVQEKNHQPDLQSMSLVNLHVHTLAMWFGMAPWIWLTLISWLLPWIHACSHDTVDNGFIHLDLQISPAPCHLSWAISFTHAQSQPLPCHHLPVISLVIISAHSWLIGPCKLSHAWLCGPRRKNYMYFPIHKVKYKINLTEKDSFYIMGIKLLLKNWIKLN